MLILFLLISTKHSIIEIYINMPFISKQHIAYYIIHFYESIKIHNPIR